MSRFKRGRGARGGGGIQNGRENSQVSEQSVNGPEGGPPCEAIEGAAPGRALGPAARRALAEAAERRRAAAAAPPLPREVNGAPGPEPTRYGDWERKGRICDF